MSILSLIYAPDPIFRKICSPIEAIDKSIKNLVDDMFSTLEHEQALGLGAPMVGVLKRVAIVDLNEGGVSAPYTFINPEITWRSKSMQTFEEASLCFPGISAKITRPDAIKLRYLDYDGNSQTLEASGFLATVIQHECDYLDGKIFLDYISRTKRDMLLKKMQKHVKSCTPHVHGPHCNH